MPAWWDSLETMTMISARARMIAWVLGIAVAICGTVVFFAGRRVDALKTAQTAPRKLAASQRAKLIDFLKGKPVSEILVICASAPDREPCNFARELVSAFRDAGWMPVSIEGTRTDGNAVSEVTYVSSSPQGVVLSLNNVEHAEPHIVTVREGLSAVSINATIQRFSDPTPGNAILIRPGLVRMIVGFKPTPPAISD